MLFNSQTKTAALATGMEQTPVPAPGEMKLRIRTDVDSVDSSCRWWCK